MAGACISAPAGGAWRRRARGLSVTDDLQAQRFAVVDVETTGLYPSSDRVVEVAIVQVDGAGRVIDRYETLVNPARDVGPTSIHGITAELVATAPAFSAIATDIRRLLSGVIWAGHNIAFDRRFLEAEFSRAAQPLPEAPTLCTLAMFRRFGPTAESHRLDCACAACGIVLEQYHCALTDAEATAALLAHLLQQLRG